MVKGCCHFSDIENLAFRNKVASKAFPLPVELKHCSGMKPVTLSERSGGFPAGFMVFEPHGEMSVVSCCYPASMAAGTRESL